VDRDNLVGRDGTSAAVLRVLGLSITVNDRTAGWVRTTVAARTTA
jgi:hypothetical protein